MMKNIYHIINEQVRCCQHIDQFDAYKIKDLFSSACGRSKPIHVTTEATQGAYSKCVTCGSNFCV